MPRPCKLTFDHTNRIYIAPYGRNFRGANISFLYYHILQLFSVIIRASDIVHCRMNARVGLVSDAVTVCTCSR